MGFFRHFPWRYPAPMFRITLAFTLIVPGILTAQTGNTASIAGKVREENGAAVRAIVTATSGAFVQRAFAAGDGSFELTKLPAGSYSLCAQTSSMEVGPREDPFVDSCAWPDLSAPKLALLAGQVRTAAAVTVKRGSLVKVRVNDPGKAIAAVNSRVPGNPILLLLSGPAGLPRNVPIIDQDAGGRTHGIVIPYDLPHKLFIHSASLALKDGNGHDFDGVVPVAVQASHGAVPAVIVVNVSAAAVKP